MCPVVGPFSLTSTPRRRKCGMGATDLWTPNQRSPAQAADCHGNQLHWGATMADEPEGTETKLSLTAEERALGMDADITRRDFLNTVALGTGAALLGAAPPGLRKTAGANSPP